MPDLKKFRENAMRYRKRGYTVEGRWYSQADLAKAIGLSADELGHRLNGSGRIPLSQENILAIVLTLAEWKTLTWEEAVSLLSSMDYPLNQPHWKTELQWFLSAPSVSGLLPSVVEVGRESKSISPAKGPVLSSTEPQQLRTPQPSVHTGKNREYAECRGWEYVTFEISAV